MEFLKTALKESRQLRYEGYSSDLEEIVISWIDSLQITGINEDRETATYDIAISMPDDVLLTDEYIAYEISNIGRVFRGNHINSHRHLLPSPGEKSIERRNGRLLVYVDRKQTVPSFINTKQRVMSEKQITRNIKNRMLNRVDVMCLSIDKNTYCGEIRDIG